MLSPIAAGLIAQNLGVIFESECSSSSTGGLDFCGFESLCRKLAGPQQLEVFVAQHKHLLSAHDAALLASAPAASEDCSTVSTSATSAVAPKAPRRANKKSVVGGLFSLSSGKTDSSGSAAVGRAESKLYALQEMLRSEVVDGLEDILQRASDSTSADEQVTILNAGCEQVLGAARRLADGVNGDAASPRNSFACGGCGGSGGGSSGSAAGTNSETDSEALELLHLRKALVETKMQLAEVVMARDEAEHALRASAREKDKGRARSMVW